MAESIESFCEFLRIKSISSEGPKGSYTEAVNWLINYVETKLKLPYDVITIHQNKPILVVKWEGKDPSLPRIILNSHYDVVPVMREHWTCDPFSAVRTDDGKIYGRGSQDMKCVCIQYLEAVRQLLKKGISPLRTMYLTFVPDEEIGGTEGMVSFVKSDFWKSMQPIGFAFDEGLACPENAFTVFYGERIPWWLLIKAKGPTGHGSRFIESTAIEKLMNVCNQALKFRQEQKGILGDGCSHAIAKKLGDVTSLNLTMLKSGVSLDEGKTYAINVVPTEASAGFDVRISPTMQPEEFKSLIDDWCKEEGVSWEYAPWITPQTAHYVSSLDRNVNPWYGLFLDTIKDNFNVPVEAEIFPAGTDSQNFRRLGIPVLGFSPMRNTPILLHEHNEWIHEDTFIEGIGIYEVVIEKFVMAQKFSTEK
eukprot:CAMPEP_0171451930 /NCGR_PEP_ID=MMETSP0945-20130129/239_1 /TAXON_ID=109269 /ORGANISM="Vaucheria litorea, Strain CCMP2940" /LENGTH=420 /DNA_ID=CAMNT_0011976491 /DNA_START=27 /DNA_END=1289 /DNA_ORIENTATION=-